MLKIKSENNDDLTIHYDKEGKDIEREIKFTRDRKNPEFFEWLRFSEPHEGVITHIQCANNVDGMARYEVHFFRPDGLGASFWIKQPV